MFKYFINISIVLFAVTTFAQEKPIKKTPKKELKSTIKKDTTTYKTAYGLRLGVDISKPIFGMVEDSYSGFEIVGDYRLNKKVYIASEIGCLLYTSPSPRDS